MNILILQRPLIAYPNAYYQLDIQQEIQKDHKCFFYGPGYINYNKDDSSKDIISKIDAKIDLIIFMHNSIDDNGKKIFFPDFSNIKTTKICFINKEYVNLDFKLDYIKKNNIDLIITHHHDYNKFQKITGIECLWLPFAVSSKHINNNYIKFKDRSVSIFTSGLIKNALQDDRGAFGFDRVQLCKELYHVIYDVPIKKKKKYNNLDVILSFDYSGHSNIKKFLYILKRRSLNPFKLDTRNYFEYLNNTKITYTTLSSVNLITPKIFESMICGSLTLCNQSQIYNNTEINLEDSLIQFKNVKDFKEKIDYYLNNNAKSQEIIDRGVKKCIENHTWEKRLKLLYNRINLA